jgi:HPt (histidine-containing phosphotransfer) domain-containing protein
MPGDDTERSVAAVPVDLDHLAQQTGGDAALEREVLALFLTQSTAILEALRGAGTAKERRELAHRLVGSSRAVGAMGVGECAATVERGDGGADAMADLASAVDAAQRFVSARLAR